MSSLPLASPWGVATYLSGLSPYFCISKRKLDNPSLPSSWDHLSMAPASQPAHSVPGPEFKHTLAP